MSTSFSLILSLHLDALAPKRLWDAREPHEAVRKEQAKSRHSEALMSFSNALSLSSLY